MINPGFLLLKKIIVEAKNFATLIRGFYEKPFEQSLEYYEQHIEQI
jgi:hypothetical protein